MGCENMKFKLELIFTILLIVFFAFFIWEAREWRLQARLYPWAIGIPMLILAVVQLLLEATGKTKQGDSDSPRVDFQFTQAMDTRVALRRTLNIFSWILGFLIATWLVGFSVTIPLLVFLYLKVQSREGWVLSLVLTGAAWLFFWALFDRLLHLPLPEGQLFVWLGL